MTNPRKKIIFKRLYLAYGIGTLVTYALLMYFVMPWWHVSNHPIVVTMGAGSAQEVALAYAADEDPLPLVPLGEPGGYHWQWGTELPPRAGYDLALVFSGGSMGEVVLKKVELTRLFPEEESVSKSFLELDTAELEGIQLKKLADGVRIFAEPGARFPLELLLPEPTPYMVVKTWAKATFGFIIFALIVFFGLSTFSQFPDRVQAYRRRVPAWESLILLVFVAAGAMAHINLVRHAIPVFTPGTSDLYLAHAIGMEQGDSSLEGRQTGEKVRPGYPFFLKSVSSRVEYDMGDVAVIQASVFCISLALLGFSITRLLRAFILGPALLIAFLSPPALWASRHIGIESLTVSSWIIGIAAFLFLWKREGWSRWIGFILFGLALACANSISSAGLILLSLPLGLLFGTLIWTISVRGLSFWRLSVFWRTLGQVTVPVMILLLACSFLHPEHSSAGRICSSPIRKSNAPFASGMFEVRALQGTDAYARVLNERHLNGFQFDGAAMSAVPNLAGQSAELLPLRAKLTAWGRLSIWSLFLTKDDTRSGVPSLTDYKLRNRFKSESHAKAVREKLTSIMQETGQVVFIPEKRSTRKLVLYNKTLLEVYAWFYRILLLAGLAAWVIGLLDRKFLAAGLVLPYMLNILLQVFTLSVSSESIQSMDALLWTGALAGLLCVNPKAMQRSTDESDRRTMRPIRPKRLFTRHKEVSRVQAD